MRWISLAAVMCVFAGPRVMAEPAHEHADHAAVADAPLRAPNAAPPKGYEKVAHEFVLFTVPGRMKYDLDLLIVRPGAKVKLVLNNGDEMQHNLVICRPGKPGSDVAMEVAQAAWVLGADAIKKHFVPDSPLVLEHTYVVNPHQVDTIYFTAPKEEVDYPFVCTLPGHAVTMRGVMRVTRKEFKTPREEDIARAGEREEGWYHMLVTDRPRVVRCMMADSSSRSIAVGLPGGMNYCFDAEGCFVRYGWFGAFLDTGPDRGRGGSRGGGANQPLGQRFPIAESFPLQLGDPISPSKVKFHGYRVEPIPTFHYTMDGIDVTQTVSPAPRGVGLLFTFEFAKPPTGPVRYHGETVTPDTRGKYSVTVKEAP